jgi:TonB family protein
VNVRLRVVGPMVGVPRRRDAARLLLAHEAAAAPPNKNGYKEMGVAGGRAEGADGSRAQGSAAGAGRPLNYAVMGVAMLVLLASAAMVLPLGGAEAPPAVDVTSPAQSRVNPPSLFADTDYPAEALAQRAQGNVRYRLQISQMGLPERCDILRSSGSAALDRATCSVMTSRSRFRPALDARGHPVPGSFTGTIEWKLPDDRG